MDEKIIYEQVGRSIKQKRDAANKTQEELAQVLKVTRASIANYESGKQAIYLSDLYKIAEFLQISISELIPPVEEIRMLSAPDVALEKASNLGKKEKEEIRSFIKEVK